MSASGIPSPRGGRMPRDRRGGGIAPASPLSASSDESCDGLPRECDAGTLGAWITAGKCSMVEYVIGVADDLSLHALGESLRFRPETYLPWRRYMLNISRAAAFLVDKLKDDSRRGQTLLTRARARLTSRDTWDESIPGGSSHEDAMEAAILAFEWNAEQYKTATDEREHDLFVKACHLLLIMQEICGPLRPCQESASTATQGLQDAGQPWTPLGIRFAVPEDDKSANVRLLGGMPPPSRRAQRFKHMISSDDSDDLSGPQDTVDQSSLSKQGTETNLEVEEAPMETEEPESLPTPMVNPPQEPSTSRRDPDRFRVLRRGQGRPRKDGSGPFKDPPSITVSDTEEDDLDPSADESQSARSKDKSKKKDSAIHEPVVPPKLTGQRRVLAQKKILEMEKGTVDEILANIDNELLAIEGVRQTTSALKGDQSGKLKMSVYALREVTRTLASRAADKGDPGYLQVQVEELRKESETLKAQNARLVRRLRRLQSEVADLRAGDPQPRFEAFAEAPPPVMTEGDEPLRTMEVDGVPYRDPTPPPPLSAEPMVASCLMGIDESLKDLNRRMTRLEGRVTSRPRVAASAQSLRAIKRDKIGKATRKRGKKKEGSTPQTPQLGGSSQGVSSQVVTLPSPSPVRGKAASDRNTEGGSRPPPSEPVPVKSWATVVSNKRGRGGGKATAPPAPSSTKPSSLKVSPKKQINQARKRLPRTAAILISGPGNLSAAINAARREVDINSLGITSMRCRGAFNGGILVEIPGEEAQHKADCLAAGIRMVLDNGNFENVKVVRPSRRLELRLRNVEETVTAEEVSLAVAKAGECGPNEVQVGPFRDAINRVRTLWVKCPARAAIKVAAAGRLQISWSSVRVELLKGRPARCFRCLARGHTQQRCPSTVDRSRCCHKCGREGHLIGQCTAVAACPICASLKKPADHMVGTDKCPPIPPCSIQQHQQRRRLGSLSVRGVGGDNPLPSADGETSVRVERSPEPDPSRAGLQEDSMSVTSGHSGTSDRTGVKRTRASQGDAVTSPSRSSKKRTLLRSGTSAT